MALCKIKLMQVLMMLYVKQEATFRLE